MNIFKYPVNEPCKQKQDPVCYACLTEVYLTKKGVKVHNIKCDTVENYVKHTAVKLVRSIWSIWSIYAWHIFNLTGSFKPAKNQTNMKM